MWGCRGYTDYTMVKTSLLSATLCALLLPGCAPYLSPVTKGDTKAATKVLIAGHSSKFKEGVVKELIPKLEERYRLIDSAESRAVIWAETGERPPSVTKVRINAEVARRRRKGMAVARRYWWRTRPLGVPDGGRASCKR